jgi:phosphoribosylformylglycinamidine synthase
MAGAETEAVHIRALRDDPSILKGFHGAIFPGGFSYGDDLGAGRILANEIKYHLLDEFRAFIEEGKLILGVCNGFQVLVKAGLLPFPMEDGNQSATLTWNDSHRFEDRWVTLKVSSHRSEFISGEKLIELPVAGSRRTIRSSSAIACRTAQRRSTPLTPTAPWRTSPGSVTRVGAFSD